MNRTCRGTRSFGDRFLPVAGEGVSAIDALATDPEGVFRPVSRMRPVMPPERKSVVSYGPEWPAGRIEGAFAGGRMRARRDALREIALRSHDAPCDPWTVLERTGNDWTGRAGWRS